jgi:hypothetical protein
MLALKQVEIVLLKQKLRAAEQRISALERGRLEDERPAKRVHLSVDVGVQTQQPQQAPATLRASFNNPFASFGSTSARAGQACKPGASTAGHAAMPQSQHAQTTMPRPLSQLTRPETLQPPTLPTPGNTATTAQQPHLACALPECDPGANNRHSDGGDGDTAEVQWSAQNQAGNMEAVTEAAENSGKLVRGFGSRMCH